MVEKNLTCDVCGNEPAVGVAAVPFVPISVAYGRKCLDANAHPYWIVVTNTAMAGGYDQCVAEWKQIVDDTLVYHNKAREQFDHDITEVLAELEASYEQEMRDGPN